MSTEPTPAAGDLPEAAIDRRPRPSLVWLVPLAALIAAVWLIYQTGQERGPLVTIRLKSAEGLEAGKTRVRYKDVDVGAVEAIDLSKDLSRVLVKARLNRDMEPYLTEQTRFWVVRPRLSGGQVSGLGTLLGGVYIGVDLATQGRPSETFEGLDAPPIVDSKSPGRLFTLRTDSLGSLQLGSPVQYRGIEVGQVVAYHLDQGSGPIEVQVFIHEPHDARVNGNTRFWHVAGLDLTLGAEGITVDSESLTTLLLGGVAFGMPPGLPTTAPLPEPAIFTLYRTQREAEEQRFTVKETWVLEFAGSVRGLSPGAPVEFRGIKIGEVKDIRLELETATLSARIPVVIDIEPQRLQLIRDDSQPVTTERRRRFWDQLVARGLRAQLKTGSLLTGALFVDLDFYPAAKARAIVWDGAIPELPTIPTPLDELRGLLLRLARMPLDEMVKDLNGTLVKVDETLTSVSALLQTLDTQVAKELTRTLQQSQRSLARLEEVLSPGSAMHDEARQVLRELGSAARSLRIMADYLERHPEALIRGKVGGVR